MDPDARRRLSSSFGFAASAYAEHRPDYAEAVLAWARLPEIRAFLATREETASGEFTLPMLTCVLRVRPL